jgi:transcriptional regulator with XRE-family HTH domain
MVAKHANALINTLSEVMAQRKKSKAQFALEAGIPKDRVYKWYQDGNNPKADDVAKIKAWISGEELPHETHQLKAELPVIIGEHEERLLRIEAHLEVYENAIAGLLTESNRDFAKTIGDLRDQVRAAVNRRFDELRMKRG